ncbi:hypothetical protein CKO28_05965 [Rhodovibrio sodomensis]|uniref:Sel1 repeat family protein n=2 Tax=Rhodovibrio sodomensis TaxID=1088 RepID=A0ABS1DBR4_9PROT|nr:hypothetical protein [Rhodovibrio sodomensis]
MRPLMRPLWAAALFASVGVFQPAHADYEAGAQAFDSGSYERAISEWRAAARGGDVKALARLGRLYEDGFGAPQNFVRAYMFYALAAARGDRDAVEARNAVGARMTADQIAEAQAKAAAWREGLAEDSRAPADAPSRSDRTSATAAAGTFTGDPCNDVMIVAREIAQNFPTIASDAEAGSRAASKPKSDYYLSRATSCRLGKARGQPGDDPILRRKASYECSWRFPTPREAFDVFQPLVDSLKSCAPLSLSFVDEASDVRDRGLFVTNYKGHTYRSNPLEVVIEVGAYGRKMTDRNTRTDDFSKLTLRVENAE